MKGGLPKYFLASPIDPMTSLGFFYLKHEPETFVPSSLAIQTNTGHTLPRQSGCHQLPAPRADLLAPCLLPKSGQDGHVSLSWWGDRGTCLSSGRRSGLKFCHPKSILAHQRKEGGRCLVFSLGRLFAVFAAVGVGQKMIKWCGFLPLQAGGRASVSSVRRLMAGWTWDGSGERCLGEIPGGWKTAEGGLRELGLDPAFLSLEAKPKFGQEDTDSGWWLRAGTSPKLPFFEIRSQKGGLILLIGVKGPGMFLMLHHAQGKTLLQSWKARAVM